MLIPLMVAFSGVLAHFFIWIRGEWDAYSGHIVLGALLLHVSFTLILHHYESFGVCSSFLIVSYLASFHVIGTFSSILVYRLIFHRLQYFPGPIGAKIWTWDIVYRTWKSGHRQSVVIDELHQIYGPIVRYAPNRLSINYAAAVPVIHGTGSTSLCTKSVVYLNPANGGSINADREVESHHARRRIWERALSIRALHSYTLPLCQVTSSLILRIKALEATPTIVNNHIQLFTFDAMGLVGFGREQGFDGLSTGILHPAIKTLIDMMQIGVYMMLFPWLHVFLDYLPTMGIIYKPEELFRQFARKNLSQYCDKNIKERDADEAAAFVSISHQGKTNPKPYFEDILRQVHPNPSLYDRRTLSDCVLLSIAGADTTTSSLVHSIYRLARHNDLQTKLYHEILGANLPTNTAGPGWDAEFASRIQSANLPLLDAFLKEVLRLHPPAATGLPRLVPLDGITFADDNGTCVHIPGHTNVAVPVYSLQRDSRYFEMPLEFLPQRFLPYSHPEAKSKLIHDSRAYIPFLQGPYGCAGKHFAYLEMKIVIAALVSAFDIFFPDNASLEGIINKMDTEWRDFSTVKAAQLEVRFVPRSF